MNASKESEKAIMVLFRVIQLVQNVEQGTARFATRMGLAVLA